MSGSGFLEFKTDYSETKNMAIEDSVTSDVISAGAHLWRIHSFPRGFREEEKGEYLSMFLEHITYSKAVNTIFHVFCLGRQGEIEGDGEASVSKFTHDMRTFIVYSGECSRYPQRIRCGGWCKFIKRSILESVYVANGWITFLCNIIVLSADTIPVPPSNIGSDLGYLLDSNIGTDVSFISFTQMRCRPEDGALGGPPTEMVQLLLAAADRYALDPLKLMCARKLWGIISVDTFASTLACAETHNCAELKSKCIDFFAGENNFKKIVFTAGFMSLVQEFPDLAAKLKERVGI